MSCSDLGNVLCQKKSRPRKFLEITHFTQCKFFENLKSVGAKKITDNWSRDGLIKIYNENSAFSVDLIIFYRSKNWMKRPGWASRLFYLHCNNSHKFPTKLIEQPLPKARFGFFSISVPRNGSEMLKYNYSPDWLKVVEHLQC